MIKIYEVMAIENQRPLFYQRHMKRFLNSIALYKSYKLDELIKNVDQLIAPLLNSSKGFNIKVNYFCDTNEFSAELIVSRKPDSITYKNGGTTGLFKGERVDPLIKRENLNFKEETGKYCELMGFYDVLLVNEMGHITEGSRSNFLLIDKDGSIISSPIGEALNGITREVIFDICKEKQINVYEKIVTEDLLREVDSLIITGTSPGILPVIRCDDIKFNINNTVIKVLQNEYEKQKGVSPI
ncbi:MAG: aminotransferase class IV [Spirochaetales bacterium]|nr:aminotransferase class IV [Spirochaetales bacterium]